MEETLDEILGLEPLAEAMHGKVIADGGKTIIVHPVLDVREMDLLKVIDTNEIMVVIGKGRGSIKVLRGYAGTTKQYATGSIILIIGKDIS